MNSNQQSNRKTETLIGENKMNTQILLNRNMLTTNGSVEVECKLTEKENLWC